jgi:hypothetical protein
MGYEDMHEADMKAAIATRMEDYVVKLSALYEVDIVSKLVKGPIVISKESIEKACLDIDNLLTQLTNNLLTQLTQDKVSTLLVKLTNTIKKKADSDGWIQHRILLQYMNCSADALQTILKTAYERDLIDNKIAGKAKFYRLKATEPSAVATSEEIATETAVVA